MIRIRKANKDDIPAIMQMMNDHWLKDYALAVDRSLFDWQFVKEDVVNIFVAADDETGKLYAMEGYIPCNNSDHPDFATTMWIAIPCEVPLVGLKLSEQLLKEVDGRAGFAIGLSDSAVKIQRRLHKPVFAMDHYYRLNDLEEYRIAKVTSKVIPHVTDTGYRLEAITDADGVRKAVSEEMLVMYSPHKSYEYVEWRYLQHPIFHYDLWAVLNADGEVAGMLVTREESANERKSAKIVDFYGESCVIRNLGYALDLVVCERGYEFMDVYSYGVDVKEYEMAGMVRCDVDSDNVIPNFFQPYTCKNTDIFMIQPLVDDARLFRGDADQDKPRYVIMPQGD